jgi:hypothetical protein
MPFKSEKFIGILNDFKDYPDVYDLRFQDYCQNSEAKMNLLSYGLFRQARKKFNTYDAKDLVDLTQAYLKPL